MVKVHQSAALLFVRPSLILYATSGPLSASSAQAAKFRISVPNCNT
jgi:hypothetical protein